MSLVDFYVKDKKDGTIHRVGDDRHDSIWVDSDGTLHYYNLQNSDGCSKDSHNDDKQGYEFVPSESGQLKFIEGDNMKNVVETVSGILTMGMNGYVHVMIQKHMA